MKGMERPQPNASTQQASSPVRPDAPTSPDPAQKKEPEQRAWATPAHPQLEPASSRIRRPLPAYVPSEPPSPESVNAQAGELSRRNAYLEDAEHVPVIHALPELSEEERSAPTVHSDAMERISVPPSAPEESGVFVRKAKPVGGEIVARHARHYSEVERPGPDAFLGHGQTPSGPNVPSVIDEIDEEPTLGEMVAKEAENDAAAASSRRKPKAA